MTSTALVVDDSRSLRAMISDTLTEAGFSVIVCGDGAEALARAGEQRVDLVITDVNMPKMDGITLVQRLRATETFRSTPILVLTTESEMSAKQRGREAGATGWMVKPFNPPELLNVVRKISR